LDIQRVSDPGLTAVKEAGGRAASSCRIAPVDWRNTMTMSLRIPALLFSLAGLAATALAQGNAENGEAVFRKCKTCHDVGPNAKNKVGPQLNQIVGRKAATIDGYSYSPAMKELGEKGVVWTEETLLKYLEKPSEFVQKTKMVFPGLPEETDRKDVVAYLKKFSK
jgi:cytochrome c2